MTRRDQGLGGLPGCGRQVNILLNVQFAMRNKHSANMFLFIVLGIFLLFSLKGFPHPNPSVGVFADLRGGRYASMAGWGLSVYVAYAERWKRRHRARSGRDRDHSYSSCSFTDEWHKALMGMVILAK